MTSPRWAQTLLRWVAPRDEVEVVLGDLEEAHRRRLAARGRVLAYVLAAIDAVDMAFALLRTRLRRRRRTSSSRPDRRNRPEPGITPGRRRGATISWLDVRLGLRMLRKYPALTLVGGLGMAVSIALSAGVFNVLLLFSNQRVTLDEGDRLVGLQNWDVQVDAAGALTARDYVAWRDGLKSIRDLAAYRAFQRNLLPPNGVPQPVVGAQMTASGFRTARVPPLIGRPLLPDDQKAGASPVMVIGYDVWKERFAGDASVVGRVASLGAGTYTVVGVMPKGFTFPASHRVWIPLPVDSLSAAQDSGPSLVVFGRLAPDVTRSQAQSELSTLWTRRVTADLQAHARVKPRIVAYPTLFFGSLSNAERWELFLTEVMVTLVLVVVGANVAILVYARTATRQAEIAVRSALGASRRRIVGQLFAEALVLAGLAAVAGLALAQVVLRYMYGVLEQIEGASLPFWMQGFDIFPGTLLFTLGLVVLAALIVGVLPGLQATRRDVSQRLNRLVGATGMRLGGTWTALIVLQVAVTVALLPTAVSQAAASLRQARMDVGFPAQEYLSATILRPTATSDGAHDEALATTLGQRLREIERRLEAEPEINGVTFAAGAPGRGTGDVIEVDGLPTPANSALDARVLNVSVAPDYFDVFGVPSLGGRSFTSEDTASASMAVIVNQSFVRDVLRGGSPLGRRLRFLRQDPDSLPHPWMEVVGVIPDFPPGQWDPSKPRAVVYRARTPDQVGVGGAFLLARVQGTTPADLEGELRRIAFSVDPTLRVIYAMPLDQLYQVGQPQLMRIQALAIVLLTLSVVLLSSAGIYALMSFTVTRRRREIGIRSALGADRRRILGGIFSRALTQLAVGGVLGVGAAVLLDQTMGGELLGGHVVLLVSGTAAFMILVGMFAALEPARRGLQVEPTEALRSDG